MTPFRRELEAMGIGAKQQNEMTANYLKLQARTARVDQMSSARSWHKVQQTMQKNLVHLQD